MDPKNTRPFLAALLIGATTIGHGQDTKVDRAEYLTLPGVYIADAKKAELQSSPSCPNGVCPGLGRGFFLPRLNALSINTGGNSFFVNSKLGDCTVLSTANQSWNTFKDANSMQEFVRNTMSEADLSGSYKTEVLTVKGTAQAMSGSESHITSTFHSTYMDIGVVTSTVDFQQDPKCFSDNNIDKSFLTKFQALAAIDPHQVGNPASWNAYVQFLTDQGSHIMMQQQIGSRFQRWVSSQSKTKNIENVLKARACADVEGVNVASSWSVKGCASYSSDERKNSYNTSAVSKGVIQGGTTETRSALTKAVNKKNLDAFVDSADEGNQAVRFIFKPIWELLYSIYSPGCAAAGKGSAACGNLQRSVNLQAAYEGWLAVGCPETKDGRKKVYQTMAVAGASSLGINSYACKVSKTGCRSNNDCRIGGPFATQCYCYGPGCLDKGAAVSGTSMFRDKVQGDKRGSYSKGVNNSCYYKIGIYCNCHDDWSGGLPDRTLYLQSTNPLFEK